MGIYSVAATSEREATGRTVTLLIGACFLLLFLSSRARLRHVCFFGISKHGLR
jgi:hypothetical protein